MVIELLFADLSILTGEEPLNKNSSPESKFKEVAKY